MITNYKSTEVSDEPDKDPDRRKNLLAVSQRPKGVVITHHSICAAVYVYMHKRPT